MKRLTLMAAICRPFACPGYSGRRADRHRRPHGHHRHDHRHLPPAPTGTSGAVCAGLSPIR